MQSGLLGVKTLFETKEYCTLPVSHGRAFAVVAPGTSRVALLSLVLTAACQGGVQAQPPERALGEMSSESAAADAAWSGVRREVHTLKVTDPVTAIAKLQKFYEKQGFKSGGASVEITSLIAQIYLQELGDREKALEIYAWGIKTYGWHAGASRLVQERLLIEQNSSPAVAAVNVGAVPIVGFIAPRTVAPPVAITGAESKSVPAIPVGGSAVELPVRVASLQSIPAPVAPIDAVPAAAGLPATSRPAAASTSVPFSLVGVSPVGAVDRRPPNPVAVPAVVSSVSMPGGVKELRAEAVNPNDASVPSAVSVAPLGLTTTAALPIAPTPSRVSSGHSSSTAKEAATGSIPAVTPTVKYPAGRGAVVIDPVGSASVPVKDVPISPVTPVDTARGTEAQSSPAIAPLGTATVVAPPAPAAIATVSSRPSVAPSFNAGLLAVAPPVSAGPMMSSEAIRLPPLKAWSSPSAPEATADPVAAVRSVPIAGSNSVPSVIGLQRRVAGEAPSVIPVDVAVTEAGTWGMTPAIPGGITAPEKISLPAPSVAGVASLPQPTHEQASIPVALAEASSMLARSAFWLQLQASPGKAEELWATYRPEAGEIASFLETATENTPALAAERLAAAGLYVEHGEPARDLKKLPAPVRLAVADYYSAKQDDKAISLYDGLLTEAKAGGPTNRWVPALGKLAGFYSSTGAYAKAADVLARVDDYSTLASARGNLTLEAARLYTQAGEAGRAGELYRKVRETSNGWGWAKGLAIHDQARVLMAAGQYEEAQRLLLTPVTGQYAEQVNIALMSLLGFSYYRRHDWANARKYSQLVLELQAKLGKLLPDEGLEEQVSAAKKSLEYLAYWEKTPFRVPPDSLPLKLAVLATDDSKARGTFSVQSFDRLELEVTSDNPSLAIATTTAERAADQGHYYQTKVFVAVAEQAAMQNLKATLTVRSPKYPATVIQVPVVMNAN